MKICVPSIWKPSAALSLGLAACFLLSGCASDQSSPSGSTSTAGVEPTRRSDSRIVIEVSTKAGTVAAPVNDEIYEWLNEPPTSNGATPPVPRAEAWTQVALPMGGKSVVFANSGEAEFDVLEILAYPDGLDGSGAPVRTEVHPLCGPQLQKPCASLKEGQGVAIPASLVTEAIDGVEYYAIAGILRPNEGSAQPDSFMALIRNSQSAE